MLPTGFGKSLIYAILPAVFDKLNGNVKVGHKYYNPIIYFKGSTESIVVIVSPLTALMLDQKQKFSQQALTVNYVGEAQQDENAMASIMKGEVQLVYMSPESLLCNLRIRRMFCNSIYQNNLVAFVVDEAHCVKMWYVKINL